MDKLKEMLLKGPLPTQGMLAARILVGGYLIYLSKSLIDGRNDSGMSQVVLFIFVAIFLIVGAVLCIKAVYSYVSGFYKGGKLDTETKEEDESSETVEETDNEQPFEGGKNTIIDVNENEIEELDK